MAQSLIILNSILANTAFVNSATGYNLFVTPKSTLAVLHSHSQTGEKVMRMAKLEQIMLKTSIICTMLVGMWNDVAVVEKLDGSLSS